MNDVLEVIFMNGCNQTDEYDVVLRTIPNVSVFTYVTDMPIAKDNQIRVI